MSSRADKAKQIEFCQKNGDPKAEWYIDAIHIINELGGLQLEGLMAGVPIPAEAPVENYCAKNGICYGILAVVKGWAGTKELNDKGWKYLKGKLDSSRYQKALEMKNMTDEEIEIKTKELLGGQYK
jgi:hypothetical protein